tara:strand:+ start:3180 stop:3620 length:441 start_codon:yes stop_codon:yes gene_type:complete
LIEYKINIASKIDLLEHLEKCDHRFIPPLSDRVILKDYSSKLYEKATTFEAWNSTELVGVISVYLNDEDKKSGFISNVSVLEDFEKKGIAGRLLEMTKDHASNIGFSKLSLEVHGENFHAINFYQRYGFDKTNCDKTVIKMNCILN